MLIPIFKPGDILLIKTSDNDSRRKLLVLSSTICNETETYFIDRGPIGSVTTHNIKTSEWVKYTLLISNSFEIITFHESDLVNYYRRIGKVDLQYYLGATDTEKDESFYVKKIQVTKEDIEQCAKVSETHDKAVLQAKIDALIQDNMDLKEKINEYASKVSYWHGVASRFEDLLENRKEEIEELYDKLIAAYCCLERYRDVADWRKAGYNITQIAMTMHMSPKMVKVHLDAAKALGYYVEGE